MNLAVTPFSYSTNYRVTLRKLYKKIIDFRRASPCLDKYCEVHHIIPKHLCHKFGIKQNSPENKVRLSVKEHQYVHMLLERARGLKVIDRKSLAFVADNKIKSYESRNIEKTGKFVVLNDEQHKRNVARKAELNKYRCRIKSLMVRHGSSKLLATAICEALRKECHIPENFTLNISRALTAGLRHSLPGSLEIGLCKDTVV